MKESKNEEYKKNQRKSEEGLAQKKADCKVCTATRSGLQI